MPHDPYKEKREQMLIHQIERRGIKDQRVLSALRIVPRHHFVPSSSVSDAYSDFPLRIKCGQTISQPYIVALMSDLLKLEGRENVLEIGTGSGYQAAILAKLAKTVHTVERHPSLAESAEIKLRELAFENVQVHHADGSNGWPPAAPYDGILVTAAAPQAPPPLLKQLAEGGRLVIPVGSRPSQTLQVWQRKGDQYLCNDILAVAFVPLRGEHGWQEEEWR
ncbi:MAG: protein-L-isoaspartate(D-aspartate) O-methyltransferase [Anaerolineaceae bacterium]|nr:protein-L-isoaspartate(D-aspartate) O-methyltransferase [Anaerolineaceae bacterium]